ncbi:MAG: ATP-binding cassette domain-containing protein [Fuerstiella sp.]
MTDPLWTMTGVSLYGDSSHRLNDVSLQIVGSVTAVVGYSGAGKTSLLNLLAGMERPDAGTIAFHRPTMSSLPLFWVPQDGGLWPHFTVRQHLEAVVDPRRQRDIPWDQIFRDDGVEAATAEYEPEPEPEPKPGDGRPRPSMANRAEAAASEPDFDSGDLIDNLLSQFDLYHRQHAFPGTLSRGEQSRLSVARCLAASPGVMLMDEPLAHVDPMRSPRYWGVIRRFLQRTDVCLAFSTHEPDVAIRESQNVICLDQGRVMFHGLTSELYWKPPSADAGAFLGPLNWFDADARAQWMPCDSNDRPGPAFRPEQLQIDPVEKGDLQVLSFHFCGSYAETQLKHVPSSAQRTLVHRPSGRTLKPGQFVRIKTC